MKKKVFRERYSQVMEDAKERIIIGKGIIDRTKEVAYPRIAEELIKEKEKEIELKPKKRGRRKSVKSDK